jgi:murein DD-endopeptidase MepM/ murein hydrolase activator NlpD
MHIARDHIGWRRWRVHSSVLAAGALLLVAAGWTTSQSAATAPNSTTGAGGATASGPLPGYQHAQSDQFSPLIITTNAPEPIPVKGSDNKYHLDYELSVLNFSPRPATITRLETLKGNERGPAISTLSQDQIAPLSLIAGDYPASPGPVTEIPPGRTAVLVLDDAYATAAAVPASVTHRMSATFGPVPAGQSYIAGLFPSQVTQIGGPVTTSKLRPVVIGPPLAGTGWVAGNGQAEEALNSHVGAVTPLGGRINGSERYAIDWIRTDPATKPFSTLNGDPSKNESYLAFDQPVLAVADARVVSVVSDQPDIAPGPNPVGLPFDQFAGNHIILDLGHGVFALYAHLKQNSVLVKVGDTVRKGQLIGRLGNSGNTTAAHLHFQLMRGPLPLTYDNVPWEIDHFTLVGSATPEGLVTDTSGPRTNAFPLGNTVSNFPTPSH